MKSLTKYLSFNTKKRVEIINISEDVKEIIKESKVKEGLCLVSAMHITASVFVNDEESGLKEDIKEYLERLAPYGDYKHHNTGEDNGDAHLKSITVGHQVIIPITNGEFDKGPWQEIFYGEWDGQRKKRVLVKVIGD